MKDLREVLGCCSRGGGGDVVRPCQQMLCVPVSRSHLRAAEAPQSLPGDPGGPQQPRSHLPQVSGEGPTPVPPGRETGGTGGTFVVTKKTFQLC